MPTVNPGFYSLTQELIISEQPPSPLPGKRWLQPGDPLVWVWQDNYWLSETLLEVSVGIASASNTAGTGILTPNTARNLFLREVRFSGVLGPGTNDATNRWDFSLARLLPDETLVEATLSGGALVANKNFRLQATINQFRETANLIGLQARWNRIETAPTLVRPNCTLSYQLAKIQN